MIRNILRIAFFAVVPLLILCLIAISYGAPEIFTGGGYGPNLSFLTNPYITGTKDGATFIKYTDLDGKTWWNTNDRDITITIRTVVKGFGDFSIALTDITFAGEDYGTSQAPGEEIGSWGEMLGILPTSQEYTRAPRSHSVTYTAPEAEGKYTWSAKGNVSLTPYKWKWKLSFKEITGEWKAMPATVESAKQASGTFTVEHKFVCPVCKDEADTLKELNKNNKHDFILCNTCNKSFRKCAKHKHDSDSGNGENNGNNGENNGGNGENNGNNGGNNGNNGGDGTNPLTPNTPPPTVPESPSNFTATPGRIAIKLLWDAPSSDGNSPITDYQYQYRRKRTATSWTAWSSWTSVGTREFEWITGLTPNRRYEVQIRAVNSVGASSSTGTTVDTRR